MILPNQLRPTAKKKKLPGLAIVHGSLQISLRDLSLWKDKKSTGTSIDKETVFRLASFSKNIHRCILMAEKQQTKRTKLELAKLATRNYFPFNYTF